MNWEEEIKKLYGDPVFDKVKPLTARQTSTDRLVESFEEINDFYHVNNRVPDDNGDTKEKKLARRLESILIDIAKRQRCMPFDRFGILQTHEQDLDAELQAIFNDQIFASNVETDALFDVPEHLRKCSNKDIPDFIAQRNKCEDFEDYEAGFRTVHKELRNGQRTLIRFQEGHLREGTYFLVGGVVVLLDRIFGTQKDRSGKTDGRTRCIFENGTESNLLLRSLGKAIYMDGYTVQENRGTDDKFLQERFAVNQQDVATGFIYVLRSKSSDPIIRQYSDLYKIGFTTGTVEDRISNAQQETTYLLADVEIIATWKTYNLNVSYFENMLHKLFRDVQLDVKIHHKSGTVIMPHEWFTVPLPVIKKAIEYIMSGIPVSYNAGEKALEEHKPEKLLSDIDTSNLKTLILNIKEVYFNEILKGHKKQEYRKIKPTTINKYTYIDPYDGKRWLKRYDAIRFNVTGYGHDYINALIEVTNTEFDKDTDTVIYSLGRIIEKHE